LAYPDSFNPRPYYAPSIFDVPNRFSLSWNYSLRGLDKGSGAVLRITGGLGLSGTTIFQSGYPFTARNLNGYNPICANTSSTAPACPSAANPAVGYAPGSGDYNADGNPLDYPDALSYRPLTDNSAWLTGAVPKCNFAVPSYGQGGNEKPMQFRGPNFFETNVNLYKDTAITERVNFQFRFEVFNLFNRANYANPDDNFPDGNFGFATASHEPRFWQIGGSISF
jgi:hypothetical protein